jgi:phosphatidate phosphatase APP1
LRAVSARFARDPVIILPYLGYGTREKLRVCGRVLEDEGFRPAAESERRWRNLVAFFKRMESDVVPHARVRARSGAVESETVADRQGYFSVELKTSRTKTWNDIELELADRPAVHATGRVLVPSPRAAFGVISDIDDTVVYSNATRKLRMIVSIALSNARTRKPFKGVAAFYRALERGVNPFFYVSKSPWNLYVPLVEYLQLQGLPAGPLLLRDFGLRMEKDHKTRAIEHILATYPALDFILVGDSAEQDPEIYAALVRRHPQRIRVIYIRAAHRDPARVAAIDRLIAEVAKTKCQLVLAPDSELAAAHAAAEGLIAAADLAAIRKATASDLRLAGSAAGRPSRASRSRRRRATR